MASRGKIFDLPFRIAIPLQDLAALCRKYNVEELAVFGSAVREDFRAESDVDFLVRFHNDDAGPWLANLTGFQQEIAAVLNRPVDVVDWKGVEQSSNPFRRTSILRDLKTLYVA
jgi:predicted nucleotidyltransferase